MGIFDNKSSKFNQNRIKQNNLPKTEEDFFYLDCLDVIKECSLMPKMQDTIIPITTEQKLSKIEKKLGKKPEETREIYIAQINPKGINLEGIDFHDSNATVIGAIDNDKLFIYTRYPEHLDIIFVDKYSYDYYGDYYYRSGSILRDGDDNGSEEIRVSTLSVSHYDGIEKGRNSTIRTSQNQSDPKKVWIDIATIIGRKRNACKYREKEMTVEKIDC